MHTTHAILVKVDSSWNERIDEHVSGVKPLTPEEIKEITSDCRVAAENEIEDYYDQAYDYFSWLGEEEDEKGITIGAVEPDTFVIELTENSQRPLRAAQDMLCYYEGMLEKKGCVLPTINSGLLSMYWSDDKLQHEAWALNKITALIYGEYLFESGFYSVPDNGVKIDLDEVIGEKQYYALVYFDYHN